MLKRTANRETLIRKASAQTTYGRKVESGHFFTLPMNLLRNSSTLSCRELSEPRKSQYSRFAKSQKSKYSNLQELLLWKSKFRKDNKEV